MELFLGETTLSYDGYVRNYARSALGATTGQVQYAAVHWFNVIKSDAGKYLPCVEEKWAKEETATTGEEAPELVHTVRRQF